MTPHSNVMLPQLQQYEGVSLPHIEVRMKSKERLNEQMSLRHSPSVVTQRDLIHLGQNMAVVHNMNQSKAKQYRGEATEVNPILSTRNNSLKRINHPFASKPNVLSLPFLSSPGSLLTTDQEFGKRQSLIKALAQPSPNHKFGFSNNHLKQVTLKHGHNKKSSKKVLIKVRPERLISNKQLSTIVSGLGLTESDQFMETLQA